ncbi:fibrinogen-like protein 1 [Palaemon carinicauda]|uniref:fibrinogen-like protein 1 n=1 Tax=Palaemon carinicauda TaxID=392227 RepID=UPI0035B61359
MNLTCIFLQLSLFLVVTSRGTHGSPRPLTYTVRETEERVRLGLYTEPRFFDDEDETNLEEGSGGNELDLSGQLVGQIRSSIADLYGLKGDLNQILVNNTGDLDGQVVPALDDFQVSIENATRLTANKLQCHLMNRIQESMRIMDRIFTLTPEQIEDIKNQVGNVSFIPATLAENDTDSTSTITPEKDEPLRDCADAFYKGYFLSDVLPIKLDRHDQVGKDVWCDQETDGGGWTVIMRRQPSSPQLDFRRDWNSYEDGFGDARGEYWIGLKTLHVLTKRQPYKLRIEMASQGNEAVALYDTFRVGPAWRKYRLRVGDYDESSTAGDAMEYHNGKQFTTYDEDNDGASGGNCANWSGGGGWWYDFCYLTNPTGLYSLPNNTEESDQYMEWRRWNGLYSYLSHFVMMIRPHEVTRI